MACGLYVILGYLSGSVLYAYYLPLWLKKLDVTRDAADGNPGVFNCVRNAGWGIGLLALACELLKGALPVWLAVRRLGMEGWGLALVLAAPAAGHAWPLLRGFRGGKSIAVSFGVMLGLLPVWEPVVILGGCYLFFSLVVRLEPHRFRSIAAYLLSALGTLLRLGLTPAALGCGLVSGIVIGKHLAAPAEERPTVRFALRRQK